MRQRYGRGGYEDEPDVDLQFLSLEQAMLVRRLFRRAMAERGHKLVVDADGNLRDAQGSLYGLWNIAILCRDRPGGEQEWPELIAGYAEHLVKANSREAWTEVAALTPEQARGLVYLSIFRAESLGAGLAGYRSAPELAPGLLELLALDMPDNTVFLDDAEVARLGGRELLREVALANLRALPAPVHRRIAAPGAHFEAIGGDSHFTASRVLVMPDLLTRVLGTEAPHGVLAAMPSRQWAFLHVLADETARPSLRKMATLARIVYGREQGRISPDVFWWRDGSWMPVPSVQSGGKVTLRPGPELGFLLAELSARSPRGFG
jgi:hypothetical protein